MAHPALWGHAVARHYLDVLLGLAIEDQIRLASRAMKGDVKVIAWLTMTPVVIVAVAALIVALLRG